MPGISGKENNRNLREIVLAFFGLLMSLVYLAIGISLIVLPQFLASYSSSLKLTIGILFIAYALFRFYRVAGAFRN
jgi:hypothetical protein